MKRRLLLLVSLFVFVVLHAHQVTEQEALQKAQQFLQGKQFIHKAKKLAKRAQARPNQSFYIFNVENNEGFVIVSGDDRTEAILGYSEHGNLDMNSAPCNVKWLLQTYDETIRNLNDNDSDSNESTPIPHTDIAPLLETTWGQRNPYNQLCPIVDNRHCLTGCAATALAQVIFYCGCPQDYTASIPAYTTTTLGIEQPELPPTKFNWDYLSEIEVSRLIKYCGQAVKMDYGLNESGAMPTDYATALNNYFGYTDATLVARADYSDDEWNELIYNELKENRAVVYSGYSTGGGHTFVIDGYQDHKFHVNWGWNSADDGYFALNYLNYNQAQSAVINIKPHYIRRSDISLFGRMQYTDSKTIERTSVTENFPVVGFLYNIRNNLTSDITLYTGIGLFNEDGLVMVISQKESTLMAGAEEGCSGALELGSNLHDGTYQVIPIYRHNENEEWQLMGGYTDHYILITINQLSMLITSSHKSWAEEMEDLVEYGNFMINGINYRLYLEAARYRADIQKLPGEQKYSGDIYIPDYVSYQNMQFEVGGIFSFSGCPELTTLSFAIPRYVSVENCPKLSSLEIREGVVADVIVEKCPSLRSVVFPASYSQSLYFPILRCDNLETITFLCNQPMEFGFFADHEDSNHSLNDIYFYSEYPPTVSFYDEIPTIDVNVHIRQGLLEAYKNSFWRGFNLIEDLPPIEVLGWDYCGYSVGNIGLMHNYDCKKNNAEMAIRIPASDLKPYWGDKITGIQFYSADKPNSYIGPDGRGIPDAYNYQDIEYAFITKEGIDYLVKANANTIRGTWVTVYFEQPYTIMDEDIYVGVGRHGCVEMTYSYVNMEKETWQRCMGTDISNGMMPGVWRKYDEGLQPLPIRILIQGENLPSDLLICGVDTVKDYSTDGSKSCRKKLWVRSRTPKLVKSFSIGIYENGELLDIQSFETSLLPNQDDYFVVDIPMTKDGHSHSVTLKILSINHEEDAIPENSTITVCYTSPIKGNYPRKIVMEEATSVGCGWSTRGIEIVKMMKESYPESFIPIAIHLDYWGIKDIMSSLANGYEPFKNEVSSLPSFHINRVIWDDALSLDTIRNTIETLKDNAIAAISAKAIFTNADSSHVFITTESKFCFDDRGTDEFRIAYVVLEDSVGPYEQMNSYSSYSLSDEESFMEWWTHQEYWPTIYHNNVARGIYNDYYGVPKSTPEIIVAGETYNGQYTLTLPDNIQQKKNIHIAVLLIDVATGEVLNADDIKIVGNISQYPHIIARNVSKVYGDALPQFKYDIIGEVDGIPEFSCDAVESSPTGTYPIVLKKGTISNPDVVLVNGTLTITKAPLTVTPSNATRKEGQEVLDVDFSYSGWKYNDDESVLIETPYAVTYASSVSPEGDYPIIAAGGKAKNYTIISNNGTLTILKTKMGDIDFNDIIDVSDIVETVSHIMGTKWFNQGTVNHMDLNGDYEVNVADVILMVRLILNENDGNVALARRGQKSDVMDDITKYTAFQFNMTIPQGSSLQGIQLTEENKQSHSLIYQQTGSNTYKVIVYSMNNNCLNNVSDKLVDVNIMNGNPDDVTTSNVLFVAPDGERLLLDRLPFTDTMGISEFSDVYPDSSVYNLQGNKVNISKRMPKGVYIINHKKMMVK